MTDLNEQALDAAATVVRGGFYMLDADVAKNSRRYAGEIIAAYLDSLRATVEGWQTVALKAEADSKRLDWFLWDNFGMTIGGYDIEDMAFRELVEAMPTAKKRIANDDDFKPLYCKHGRAAIDTAITQQGGGK